ncbi:conserved hypothetical protein [Uncinocarpus reesii 1704]|uniref:Uncharacterized protein n=1 Tax=Uncinocarpus reesii (strain UAMH 1704) TaxID=336963 RepID=C4JGF0_UNCRE|nr:uncharacterized protein UREG_01141 [Uncinocarpus reesii 1704]EEP76292.1 conserved hypothetical protein [Uncinocarpus reesii 1704]
MVNEREPSKYSTQNNGTTAKSRALHEFGQPSPLGSNRRNPFYIPKANEPRPEHHRPTQSQTEHLRDDRLIADPFRAVKPSSTFTSYRSSYKFNDDDAVEIMRPTNAAWTTQPRPKPYFSSKPITSTVSRSSSNLKTFMDLTTTEIGLSSNASTYNDDSRSMEAFTYVDSAKANENIKALLEGAFEDEDDKPRTRLRKKKLQNQVDELADKLKGIDVNEPKESQKDANAGTKLEEDEEGEEVDDGTVEGLKVKLLPHQIEGVSWMREKETGQKKTRGVLPKGGILADDMGLGKTVQTIALMLTNPRPTPEKENKTANKKDKTNIPAQVGKGTLIVAPVALVKQWETEISTKIEATHRLKVGIYHGSGRTRIAKDLTDYDVIITTYGTLSSEHGGSTKTQDRKSGCFSVCWYRIVLDEAHTIKNRNAKSTQAVYALDALYRWCLTGTPMQNNLDELQSLIRFLRIKPYDELAAWREQITRPLNNGRGGLAIRRLQVYLKAFMKRRTKDVLKLDGGLNSKSSGTDKEGNNSSSGFRITKRDVIKIEADFTAEEREFYSRLEDRTDKSLENMIGHQKLNYASALVLLLRLRQACNHLDLVKGDLAQEKDTIIGTNGSQSKVSQGADVDEIANMLGGLSVISKRCDICLIDLTSEEAQSGAIRCNDCEADLKIHTGLLKEKKTRKDRKKKSKDNYVPGQTTEQQKSRAQRRRVITDSDDEDAGEWIVPQSKRVIEDLGKAGGPDDENAEGGGEWIGSEDSETSEDEDEDGDESIDIENEEDLDDTQYQALRDAVSSTKIRHLLRILKREAGEFKFIVFSVFTSMLDKIEPFLKGAGIGYARYDGGMRNDLREASLDRLRNSSSTRVLLCSLRAGSLGLNLTAASRVVILEPFWNPFVEEQAIDRVHRLNQTVDVKVYKMTIRDTVEARILDLQERKRELASATIEGKTAASKLTMNDMLALFRHDAEAKFADDDGLDFSSGKGRLLESKEASENKFEYPSLNTSSRNSGSNPNQNQGRRATPPIMERDRNKNRKPVEESSIFGRRW